MTTVGLEHRPGEQDVFIGFRKLDQPYPHAQAERFFSPGLCSALLDYLESAVAWQERHIDDFYDLLQIDLTQVELQAEVRFLTTPGFLDELRRGVERLFGCVLDRRAEVTVHKMLPGYKIKVHTDSGKGQSHRLLVQLNRGWSEEAGGVLMLLDSENPAAANENHKRQMPKKGGTGGASQCRGQRQLPIPGQPG